MAAITLRRLGMDDLVQTGIDVLGQFAELGHFSRNSGDWCAALSFSGLVHWM